MKFSFFLFLLPFIIASSSFNYEAFFRDIIKQTDFGVIINKIEKAIDSLHNLFYDNQRKDIAQRIAEVILYFKNNYKEYKAFVKQLEDLQKKLSKYGVSNTSIFNGIYSFYEYTIKAKMQEISKTVFYIQNYCLPMSLKDSNNLLKLYDSNGGIEQNANLLKQVANHNMGILSSLQNKLGILPFIWRKFIFRFL